MTLSLADITQGAAKMLNNGLPITLHGDKRGATLDFLLHILANILVILGYLRLAQKAKVCTSAC